jgi:hypothetical protein
MSGDSLQPPDGLEEAGLRLWTAITEAFDLNAGELEILRQACATSDEIVQLERELRSTSLTVAGYNGQPRPNPLIRILQEHRLLLRRLVDSLRLPDLDEESGLSPSQRHAQKAARGRWSAVNEARTLDERLFSTDKQQAV